MNDELFTIPPQDSPRLAWLKKHEIQPKHNKEVEPGDEDEFGDRIYPFSVYGSFMRGEVKYWLAGFGDTEDEALVDFARGAGIRLWNEE